MLAVTLVALLKTHFLTLHFVPLDRQFLARHARAITFFTALTMALYNVIWSYCNRRTRNAMMMMMMVILGTLQILRLAVASCSLYGDCESCVSSQDVLGCVWCGGHCVTRSECQPSHFDPQQPYDTHCPPVILYVRSLQLRFCHT